MSSPDPRAGASHPQAGASEPQVVGASDAGRPTALVLRALHLGDLITGLPALRMLRLALPGHRIVLAAPEVYGTLALSAGVVDELTPGWELDPLTEAPRGAEVAIDLHGNGPASRELLEATGARRVVAYDVGPHRWDADEHEVHRWCRLVAEAFDVAPPWPGLRGQLPTPDAPRGTAGAVLIHPGASAPAREWPVDRYAAVAAALAADGHRVLVTGGPGEEQLARDVVAAAGVGQPLTGLPLSGILGAIGAAALLVSGDTGVAHVAAVLGTPSVTLFGPVSPARWGPPTDPRHVALWHGVTPGSGGDPHAPQPDPALLDITVDEVVGIARGLLATVDTVATAGATR